MINLTPFPSPDCQWPLPSARAYAGVEPLLLQIDFETLSHDLRRRRYVTAFGKHAHARFGGGRDRDSTGSSYPYPGQLAKPRRVASILAHESLIGVVNVQENQFDGQTRSKSHRQDAAIGLGFE